MATEPKPNQGLKACLLGCGVLVALGLVLLLVLAGVLRKSAQGTMNAANDFIHAAVTGDDEAAYGLLHALQREKTSRELFHEHWDAARNVLGADPTSQITGQPAANFDSGLVTFQYQATGGSGTVLLEVDVNPGEKPPTVVNYRITGVPQTPPSGTPGESTIEVVPGKPTATEGP